MVRYKFKGRDLQMEIRTTVYNSHFHILPDEILLDVLKFKTRFEIDKLRIACKRLDKLILCKNDWKR